MRNLTIYPFTAPLLADLEHLDNHQSVLPVNPRVAQALRGTTFVLASVHGHILRTELHPNAQGQTVLRIDDSWIQECGLPVGVPLDIEVAADAKRELELARQAEARAVWLMHEMRVGARS